MLLSRVAVVAQECSSAHLYLETETPSNVIICFSTHYKETHCKVIVIEKYNDQHNFHQNDTHNGVRKYCGGRRKNKH